MKRRLDPFAIRRVAVAAVCDPRTVRDFLSGKPVRSTSRTRIETALRRLGLRPERQESRSAAAMHRS